mmetsp:Transcript_15909/g.34398  ORF Transcript_15909/g.34398 Transcript_15909/m.34398 type:complete len:178 (-) Transcript_15909:1125-1658(-)
MKLFLATISTAFAFAPSPTALTQTTTSLHGASGDDIRASRSSFAPMTEAGHVGTTGTVGTSDAPFTPRSSPKSYSSVSGDDIREGRSSYAPFSHAGRVGTTGEIGAVGGVISGRAVVPNSSPFNGARVVAPFVAHSSTGADGMPMSSNSMAAQRSSSGSSAGPPKKYGLGSGGWKKN